jgi:CubicO group peptidase (beta-lactamase class C family)
MARKTRWLGLAWLATNALTLSSARADTTGPSDTTGSSWHAQVSNAIREVGFHGVIRIEERGRVVVSEGVGENGERLDEGTRYWIASISKSFTATLIFRLAQEGAPRMSDSLAMFFPDAPADKRSITIEQLLTHTSGLPNKYAAEGIVDRDEAARRILDLPLRHAPGEAFGYTNDGYSLLAVIAEIEGKAPFGELLERKILGPARMRDTGLWPSAPGRKAILPLSVTLPPEKARENWGYKGPEGICSNAAGLASWMHALLDGKILEADTLQAMWRDRCASTRALQPPAGSLRPPPPARG